MEITQQGDRTYLVSVNDVEHEYLNRVSVNCCMSRARALEYFLAIEKHMAGQDDLD